MWDEIFYQAANNGLWALMFVTLLVFILKDSKRREEKYQETVRRLSQSLNIVLDIRDDIKNLCLTLQGLKCVSEASVKRAKKQSVKIKEVLEDEFQDQAQKL